MTENTLIDFPTDFPIKIFGPDDQNYIDEIHAIVKNHFPKTTNKSFTHKNSSKQKWIAITATIFVQSKKELDMLYMDLTKHPLTKMVL